MKNMHLHHFKGEAMFNPSHIWPNFASIETAQKLEQYISKLTKS
jgi:hypothetical protein